MKEFLKDPAVIVLGLQLIALLIAKLDKSDKVAGLIIKLGEVLKSKK